MPEKLIRLLVALYSGAKSSVVAADGPSAPIGISVWSAQGLRFKATANELDNGRSHQRLQERNALGQALRHQSCVESGVKSRSIGTI